MLVISAFLQKKPIPLSLNYCLFLVSNSFKK